MLVVAPLYAVVWFARCGALFLGAVLGGALIFSQLFGEGAVFDVLRIERMASGTAFASVVDALGVALLTGLMAATMWLLHAWVLPYWGVAALVYRIGAGVPMTAAEARRLSRYLGTEFARSPGLRVPRSIWQHDRADRRTVLFRLANEAASSRGLPLPFPEVEPASRRSWTPPPQDPPDFDNPESARVERALHTLGIAVRPQEFAPIRRAWKSLIQAHHPDRHARASPEAQRHAAKRTAEINAAYQVLEQAYAARTETVSA